MACRWEIIEADVLEALRAMPDCSVDGVLSDPPYGLGTREPTPDDIVAYIRGEKLDTGGDFRGRGWELPSVAVWRELSRVMRPDEERSYVEIARARLTRWSQVRLDMDESEACGEGVRQQKEAASSGGAGQGSLFDAAASSIATSSPTTSSSVPEQTGVHEIPGRAAKPARKAKKR